MEKQSLHAFVAPIRPNQIESKWQHDRCVVLEDELEGTIVIDVLKENEIDGIEFFNSKPSLMVNSGYVKNVLLWVLILGNAGVFWI